MTKPGHAQHLFPGTPRVGAIIDGRIASDTVVLDQIAAASPELAEALEAGHRAFLRGGWRVGGERPGPLPFGLLWIVVFALGLALIF